MRENALPVAGAREESSRELSTTCFSCARHFWKTGPTKTGDTWRDEKVIAIPCEQDDVDEYLEAIVNFSKNTNSLIVLDDCASGRDIKNRTSEIVKLAFHGRHIGLSTIVITQQLTSVAKPYRMNVSKVVFFLHGEERRPERHLRELPGCQQGRGAENNGDALKNNKHARLEILTVFPYTHQVIIPE